MMDETLKQLLSYIYALEQEVIRLRAELDSKRNKEETRHAILDKKEKGGEEEEWRP